MKLDDSKSIDRPATFEEMGVFFDNHPLSSPTFSVLDRPEFSDTDSLQDLNEMYATYVRNITNPNGVKQKEIQASFDRYVKSAARMVKEPTLMADVAKLVTPEPVHDCHLGKRSDKDTVSNSNASDHKDNSEKARSIVQRYKVGCLNSINEVEQRMVQGELQTDSYAYYIVLNKVWTSEYVKKRDIKVLQPCKVLLLRSIVKRKFDEELALQWPNQRPLRHQEPSERPPL